MDDGTRRAGEWRLQLARYATPEPAAATGYGPTGTRRSLDRER